MSSNNVISMSKFLFIYYNIEGEVVNKLTHSQINEMLHLGQIPNDKISTGDITTGKILLVRDSEGIVRGYKNPLINKSNFTEEEPSNIDITIDEEPSIDINNIDNYSDYELTELIKVCKKAKDDKTKNLVIKELNKRGSKKSSKYKALEKVRKRDLRKE